MSVERKEAYLDSSVVLTRRYGTRRQRKKVIQTLIGRKKITSSYIKREMKRTFLYDMIWLHSLLIDEKDIPPVFDRIRDFSITPRRQKRCIAILEQISLGGLRYPDAVTRLENLIFAFEKDVLRNVKIIESGTGCNLAKEEIEINYPIISLNISCTRSNADCCLPNFVNQNRAILKKLRDDIAGIEDCKQLRETLDEILQDPEKSKGNNCKTLGDTIICLDSPIDCDILSTNEKDFKPICDSMNKPFVSAK